MARSARHWPPVERIDPPPSAEALLERVALGDEIAFERLYDLVAGQVYGMALRVVRDPAQSEEVAQEVLVEVWRTASPPSGCTTAPDRCTS
jgi:RNA polymerase sigma-70 factor (ECF subfamily)